MPADDTIKPAVVAALDKDGWTITDDPFTLEIGDLYLFIDLAAVRFVVAKRGMQRIAVEIKSFPSKSKVADLQQAVGQYVVYRTFLRRVEPDWKLFLAIANDIYERVFVPETGQAIITDLGIQLIVVNLETEEIIRWVTQPHT